ncbi:hypothetical protein AQUCO_00300781v1 [Aquilegia coerulea]|uniref:Pentacotripeptide-repeat region of PRORP domain-containing protein n=1 Tax=Aquilegia coerulea TaxID=218851 RepID=A0A2G5F0K5_AQUCA|nr:hypothetical protein AQUCO_00300781v1 [Aquilegia coerulea]
MIRAFSYSHFPQNAISIYTHMKKMSISPNNYTFPFLLKSISDLKLINQGQTIHTQVLKLGYMSDIYVLNSLLNVYSSCGDMNICEKLFDEMPQRDVVSWTILIEGNRNIGKLDDAHLAFQKMLYSGVLPNRVTMVNVLSLCASSGMLSVGVWVDDYIRRSGWELDVILGTSLVDMYAKCGKIEEALGIFQSMNEKNVSTWNSLIRGLALAKSGEEAMRWFSLMELEGINPDEVTLLAVLSACSHSGMVQTGRNVFNSIVNGRYGFQPSIKHFGCMIDMLARAGCLDEAFKLIETMPFKPTKSMWGALHTGCRLQGSLELCEFTAWKLIELEPEIAAYYASLSNLYAEMGRWSDVEKVRKLMKERKLVKDAGNSFIEVQDHKKQDYVSC